LGIVYDWNVYRDYDRDYLYEFINNKQGRDMTAREEMIIQALTDVINYPKGIRGAKDDYPSEVVYDEFAYKRMVDSYRNALREIIKIHFGGEKA